MGDLWVIVDNWGVNRATLHDVAVIGGQSHYVLGVFDHAQELAAILVHVGYLKTIDRAMSYDVTYDGTRHRATSRLIARYLCNSRATTPYDFIYGSTTS